MLKKEPTKVKIGDGRGAQWRGLSPSCQRV